MAQQCGGLLGGLEERLEAWLEVVLCAEQQRLLLVVRRAVLRGVRSWLGLGLGRAPGHGGWVGLGLGCSARVTAGG